MVYNPLKNVTINNLTNEPLKKEISEIKKILRIALNKENLTDVYFNVIIVDNTYIQKLNKTYRHLDKPTDVISFALEDEKDLSSPIRLLGDIYISLDKAKEQAESYEHSLEREICFLAVHGLLHLLGYDHQNKEEEKIMFQEQEWILNENRCTKL